jgi:hypothetical protein
VMEMTAIMVPIWSLLLITFMAQRNKDKKIIIFIPRGGNVDSEVTVLCSSSHGF